MNKSFEEILDIKNPTIASDEYLHDVILPGALFYMNWVPTPEARGLGYAPIMGFVMIKEVKEDSISIMYQACNTIYDNTISAEVIHLTRELMESETIRMIPLIHKNIFNYKEYEYMSNMITNCIVDNFCSDYYTKTEDNNDR